MKKYNALLHGTPKAWDIDRKPHGGGGGGGDSKTVQEIPVELKPLARAYTEKAINLGEQQFQPYTGQRYEDLNQSQNLGLGMVQDRALGGSATINNAEGALNNQIGASNPYLSQYDQFIQGQQNPYLENLEGFMSPEANPYLGQMYDQGAGRMTKAYNESVLPGVNSTFSLAGRYGSNAHQTAVDNASDTLGQNLGNLATNMYGGAYDQDRGRAMNAVGLGMNQFNTDTSNRQQALGTAANFRNADVGNQLQSIGMAPQFGNMAYQDASQLLNAGQILQDQAQQNKDFSFEQFQEQQNDPYKKLAAMSGVFGTNLGSSSTTTQSGGGGK